MASNGRVEKSHTLIDPETVRFTHSKIRPFFSGCGRKIADTLDDLVTGKIQVEALPVITVTACHGTLFSLNNRRLYVLKELRRRGLLKDNMVRVRLKTALKREEARYTVERCSLRATIMTEYEKQGGDYEGEDGNAQGDDEVEQETMGNDTDLSQRLEECDISAENKPKPREPQRGKKMSNKEMSTKAAASSSGVAKETEKSHTIPPAVQKSIKNLRKLIDKGKEKQCLQQIYDFIDDGVLAEELFETLCGELGIESR